MESILLTTKKLLGITEDYTHFDQDIIVHINSALMSLFQLGVGPKEGFRISGVNETWGELNLPATSGPILGAVQDYIYMKTRLAFDPPQSGSLLDALKQQIAELEWRLSVSDNFGKEVMTP